MDRVDIQGFSVYRWGRCLPLARHRPIGWTDAYVSIEIDIMYMYRYVGIGLDGWIEVKVRVNPHI